jgi:hypothetical protein
LSKQYDFIIRHEASARLLSIQATCDISIYCALALFYGEDFALEKNWSEALADIKSGKINIEEAIEQVEVVLDYEGEDEVTS